MLNVTERTVMRLNNAPLRTTQSSSIVIDIREKIKHLHLRTQIWQLPEVIYTIETSIGIGIGIGFKLALIIGIGFGIGKFLFWTIDFGIDIGIKIQRDF